MIVDFLTKGSLFLAPMSGFTDSAFRIMARQNGADVCVSEFVHSRAVLSGAKKVLDKLRFESAERPYGIQLFGADPEEVADAASFVEEEFAPDFLDINYGCPAPNAVYAGAGAALLKDPALMGLIAHAASKKLKKIPLTAKMRTGWGASTILPDAAKMLEQSGVKLLTIHGRSKIQGYCGDADWPLIEKTAEALSIPLIGNGSVEKLSIGALKDSACFGFMVGRAAVGNPWIFSKIKASLYGGSFVMPSALERIEAALAYTQKISLGDKSFNIINYKPNIIAFLRGFEGFKKIRAGFARLKTADEVVLLLSRIVI